MLQCFTVLGATFSGPVSGTSTLSSLAPSVAGAVLGASGAGAAPMPAPGHWNIHLTRVCIHRFFRYFLKFCFIFFIQKTCSEFLMHSDTPWAPSPGRDIYRVTMLSLCCHCHTVFSMSGVGTEGIPWILAWQQNRRLTTRIGVVLSCKSLQPSHASTKHTLTGLECWKIACEAAQGTCIERERERDIYNYIYK